MQSHPDSVDRHSFVMIDAKVSDGKIPFLILWFHMTSCHVLRYVSVDMRGHTGHLRSRGAQDMNGGVRNRRISFLKLEDRFSLWKTVGSNDLVAHIFPSKAAEYVVAISRSKAVTILLLAKKINLADFH